MRTDFLSCDRFRSYICLSMQCLTVERLSAQLERSILRLPSATRLWETVQEDESKMSLCHHDAALAGTKSIVVGKDVNGLSRDLRANLQNRTKYSELS